MERVALVHGVAVADADDDVVGRALDPARAVDERVGAELLLIDGMGHDIPPALFPAFADAIRRTANRTR